MLPPAQVPYALSRSAADAVNSSTMWEHWNRATVPIRARGSTSDGASVPERIDDISELRSSKSRAGERVGALWLLLRAAVRPFQAPIARRRSRLRHVL